MKIASDPASCSLAEHALYVFCIARLDLLTTIDAIGGDGDGVLQLIPFHDVVAVVSTVSVNDFCGPVAEARLKDVAWVGRRAWRHEAIVERVMQSSPILPARFATLFSSRERLEAWLAAHHAAISASLDRVTGHEEWAVKGRLDRQRAEARLFVAALERERGTLPPSPGTRYLDEHRIRARVGRELDLWLEEACDRAVAELQVHATEFRERVVVPEARVAGGLGILNWAFLVARRTIGDFGATVRRLNHELHDQGLVLDVSGPWPPYSFCPSLEPGSLA